MVNTTNYKGIGYALEKGVLKIGTSSDNDVFSNNLYLNTIGRKGLEHTKLFIKLVNSYYGKEICGLKNVSVLTPMSDGNLDFVQTILDAGGTFTDSIFIECEKKGIFNFVKNVMFGKYACQYINTTNKSVMIPMRYGHLDLVEAILKAGGKYTDLNLSEFTREAISGGIQHSEKEYLHFIKNVMFGRYADQYVNTKSINLIINLFTKGIIEIICYLLENRHVLISTFHEDPYYNYHENIWNHARIRPYLDQESEHDMD